MRILLVEDNEKLALNTARSLTRAGFVVDQVGSCEDALFAVRNTAFEAVVLDIGLPDGDGYDILQAARDHSPGMPVVFLTAYDKIDARIRGLNAGADDYMVKPFAVDELVARLHAVLRRPRTPPEQTITLGNVAYEPRAREVMVNDAPLRLTRRETDLFQALLRRPGRILSKDALEEQLYNWDAETSANAIEVAVYRLRRKLESAGATVSVTTLRGIGYMVTAS